MASLIAGYNNDIFSNYRKKDNKATDKDTRDDIDEHPGRNKITRRKFFKGVAGATVCYACFSLDCLPLPELRHEGMRSGQTECDSLF